MKMFFLLILLPVAVFCEEWYIYTHKTCEASSSYQGTDLSPSNLIKSGMCISLKYVEGRSWNIECTLKDKNIQNFIFFANKEHCQNLIKIIEEGK